MCISYCQGWSTATTGECCIAISRGPICFWITMVCSRLRILVSLRSSTPTINSQ
uniref:Uncharacterized protein n=1 Tax=Arundo donax TaxID=35708 RepID=A0A0A9E3U7_ARUDO